MKKIIEIKNKKIFFMLFIMVVATIYFTSKAFANEEDTDLSYSTIHCEYEGKQTGFTYSNEMFLKNSEELSTDMAKMSVILSACAYDPNNIDNALSLMEFERTLYNYDRVSTIEDNDYVAFTIASKNIKYKGQDYKIYVVPIRGTPESAEWFSNFRLSEDNDASKTTGNHYGFYTAANEVRNEISYRANNDGIPAERTVLLLTGHSRGAAVANIVAGQLSGSKYANYLSKEHIFGYTFACPFVSKYADDALTNIYNFNNPGDPIPLLPLEEWGYKRFGKTVELDTAHWDNVGRRFKQVCGKDFRSMNNSSSYKKIISDLIVNENDFFSADNKTILVAIAFHLGGKESVNLPDVIKYYLGKDGDEVLLQLLSFRADGTGIGNIKNSLKFYNVYKTFLENGASKTASYTEEEFENWLNENQETIDKIENQFKVNIDSKEDLSRTLIIFNEHVAVAVQAYDLFKDLEELGFDNIPNMKDIIGHRSFTNNICYLD